MTRVSFTYEWEPPTSDSAAEPVLLDVTASVSPYVPAQTYGPPENCYPAEGGGVEELVAFTPSGREADLTTPTYTGSGPLPLGDVLEDMAVERAIELQHSIEEDMYDA